MNSALNCGPAFVNRRRHPVLTTLVVATLAVTILAVATLLTACQASSVQTVTAELGEPSDRAAMLAAIKTPGSVKLTKWRSANWQVPLEGLLNLEHPNAIAAGIENRNEPIEIYTYSLEHPTQGTFLIDSGISALFFEPGGNPKIGSVVEAAMGFEAFEPLVSTAEIGEKLGGIDGVFITHIHIDHILGLNDLPADTPVYIGPGDASAKALLNMASAGTTNRLLETQGLLQEWNYEASKILDVFGDGSVFAIHSPGHTPGATAFLVNSTDGPQLMLGDVTHTQWGWDNGVEPGSYSADIPTSATSLLWLKALAEERPDIRVHPGHQDKSLSL